MLLRSVGRWSPGQLLAPSSWRSLNPPWLGYFFSFQWKITQRDPSAHCFYSHQVSKEWKDNLLKGLTVYIVQAWTLYSSSQSCPRLEFKLSWWPRWKLPLNWNQKREFKLCDPFLGKSGVLNVSYFLRWRPQCSRSSRRSSLCSSPSASHSTSSYPPPRYLYLYL